jgi:RNA polymerase sigma-70 factor (ECF subfamily)
MEALSRFLQAIAGGDAAAAEALLAEDARSVSDGGGIFHAALKPILGRARVTRAFLGLQRREPPGTRFAIRTLNGLPALVAERTAPLGERDAPRFAMTCTVDQDGRITAIYSVLAPGKLAAVRPIPPP